MIAAVFLLLLMAVLAAAIANMVSTSQVNLAADIGGTRAYQAARAGAEWGIVQLDPNAQGAGLPACVDGTPAVPGHTVMVTCASSDHSEAGRSIRIYRIVSLAVAEHAPGISGRDQVHGSIAAACLQPGRLGADLFLSW